jgi:exopolysaccharide biosynthesis polyprenyl glycosylphosphotransferase
MRLPFYKYLFAVIDFIILLGAIIISAYLVRPAKISTFGQFINTSDELFIVFIPLTFIFLFIFQSNNLYKLHVTLSKSLHLTVIIKSIFYSVLVAVFFSFMTKFEFILDSRKFILFFTAISLWGLIIFRIVLLRNLLMKLNRFSVIRRKVIIAGAGNSGKILAAKLQMENDLGIEVVGFVDDSINIGERVLADKDVVGRISELPKLVKELKINEVIISIDNTSYERLLEILDICNKLEVNVKLNTELFKIVSQKMDTEKYSDIPIVDVSPRVNRYLNIILKRIFDVLGALIGLVLLSPVLIIISILIKLTSPGPVLYSQVRIGKKGKEFKFYKFRSMTVSDKGEENRQKEMIEFIKNGSKKNGDDVKIVNEKRVTWIGKFIRKTSLDELPQLLNVLKGDMSLVGPRPCLPYEFEHFDNWQKRKVEVLPGCTGVWQVSGRSSVSFNDSIVLDLYYINNMTPWLDLQIIIKTLPVMIFSRGGK